MPRFEKGQTVYLIAFEKIIPATVGTTFYTVKQNGRPTEIEENWIFPDEKSARNAMETKLHGWTCSYTPRKQHFETDSYHVMVNRKDGTHYYVRAYDKNPSVTTLQEIIECKDIDAAKLYALETLAARATETIERLNELVTMFKAASDKIKTEKEVETSV